MINGFKFLTAYRDIPDAYISKGKLEDENIICLIRDEYTVQMNWFYSNAIGGVKLYVKEEEYEKAKSILSVQENIIFEECPVCKSTNIVQKNRSRLFIFISLLLLAFPSLIFKSKAKCQDCNATW